MTCSDDGFTVGRPISTRFPRSGAEPGIAIKLFGIALRRGLEVKKKTGVAALAFGKSGLVRYEWRFGDLHVLLCIEVNNTI